MKRIFLAFIFCGGYVAGYGQLIPAAWQEVVDAEKGFAGLSKSTNTVNAFLTYLDEKAVVFSDGKPVNARELWSKRQPNSSLLWWWPVWADVSVSGDLGYTTGPYEISKDRSGAAPVVFGYYSTVWKKNATGEWKVAIDMGTIFPAAETEKAMLKMPSIAATAADSSKKSMVQTSFLAMDSEYVRALNTSGKSFLPERFSAEGRIHRNGHWPYTGTAAIRGISEGGMKFIMEHSDGELASSGDLGYTYGTVTVEFTENGLSKTTKSGYLRVWKKEAATGWRIVLDVIGG